MLSRFSKWGRAAAYVVVLGGLAWLLVAGQSRNAQTASAILVGAYAAYVVGATAEHRRKLSRRKRLMDNQEM